MRFPQACLLITCAALAPLLLGGCSILREFGPVVEVHTLPAREAIELKRGDILTRGKLSDATVQTIRVAALDEQACAKPISSECAEALATVTGVATDRRLAALSELWLAQAQAMKPGSAQQAAWLETIRYAYAYLFMVTILRESGPSRIARPKCGIGITMPSSMRPPACSKFGNKCRRSCPTRPVGTLQAGN